MSWEQRGNNLYYYRTRRINGRVVKEYLGTGASAHAAAEDEARRQDRQIASAQRKSADKSEALRGPLREWIPEDDRFSSHLTMFEYLSTLPFAYAK